MIKKENALRILRFDNPERVVGEAPCHWLAYTGCNHETIDGGGGHESSVGSRWTDIWGTGWFREQDGVMGFPRKNPLAEMSSLKNYAWPDPEDERICGKIYTLKKKFQGGDCFLAGSHRDTLWEKSYMLAGMENMMVWLRTEPNHAREILRGIMDFQLGIAKHYLACGIEWAGLGDDLGTQNSLLIGEDLLREFFFPEYKRLFDLYKRNGVLISFHSCGHVEPVLEMFMELGVDCLNPVQATANNLARVREATRGRMALQGGVSTGLVMKGPAGEIKNAVRGAIHLLGRNGGYFCGPDQGMPFPPEHCAAFQEAVAEFGKYPL